MNPNQRTEHLQMVTSFEPYQSVSNETTRHIDSAELCSLSDVITQQHGLSKSCVEPPPTAQNVGSSQRIKPNSKRRPRECAVDGCKETTFCRPKLVQMGKTAPWMCTYHRNKTYKETYKRKKGEEKQQAEAIAAREGSASTSSGSPTENDCKRRCGSSSDFMKYQGISMLEQVLNEKKLALMRTPEVANFLQQCQRGIKSQHRPERSTSNPR
ncbi:regulatory factor X-associated protein-like [Saccoglossus kowalevskii]|uniref:Regulatory factor X-associated protein-like n=1 Tax=Saccoglossus kowalevskii TaxID=10224 RepID=A0ABM0GUU0_SACKO|nr:PREDICTED: regulatory factor X-associated protein-like [Saccoglossus kowalevskii]